MEKNKNFWWAWILIGLLFTWFTSTGSLLGQTAGPVLVALGFNDLISKKVGGLVKIVIVVAIVLFYEFNMQLLAGGLPRLL